MRYLFWIKIGIYVLWICETDLGPDLIPNSVLEFVALYLSYGILSKFHLRKKRVFLYQTVRNKVFNLVKNSLNRLRHLSVYVGYVLSVLIRVKRTTAS